MGLHSKRSSPIEVARRIAAISKFRRYWNDSLMLLVRESYEYVDDAKCLPQQRGRPQPAAPALFARVLATSCVSFGFAPSWEILA
jgi:hypothetical protein